MWRISTVNRPKMKEEEVRAQHWVLLYVPNIIIHVFRVTFLVQRGVIGCLWWCRVIIKLHLLVVIAVLKQSNDHRRPIDQMKVKTKTPGTEVPWSRWIGIVFHFFFRYYACTCLGHNLYSHQVELPTALCKTYPINNHFTCNFIVFKFTPLIQWNKRNKGCKVWRYEHLINQSL